MAYNKIVTKEGLQAVREKPGMYVGSTTSSDEKTSPRGLIQIAQEIISNGADEAMNGYGDVIKVTLNKDNSLTVEDSGRGIPRGENYDDVIRAFTKLHSSGKFTDAGDAYEIAGGTHGVGSKATTALSKWVKLEVKTKEETYSISFKQDKVTSKSVTKKKNRITGTKVTFLPDDEVFSTTHWEVNKLENRIDQMSFVTPGVKYVFDNQQDSEFEPVEFYNPNGMADLVSRYGEDLEYIGPAEPLRMQGEYYFEGSKLVPEKTKNSLKIKAEVSVAWTDEIGDTTVCMTNGIPNPDGGPHRDGARRAITKVMNDYGLSSKVIKPKDPKLTPDDTREGIILAISVGIPEEILQFESQTKEKLGTTQADAAVYNLVLDQLSKWMYDNHKEAEDLVNRMKISQEARKAAAEFKNAAKDARKKGKGSKLELSSKLAAANIKDKEKRELYLVEGDSAGGSVIEGRARMKVKGKSMLFQAVLPLRGKILNAAKTKLSKLLANNEASTILRVLGAGFGNDYDESKLEYNKVVIVADADDDGAHIASLIITFFWIMMPEFIINGHLYVAEPPLYRFSKYKNGKREKVFAKNIEEYDKIKHKYAGWQETRLKGLGEMNASELRETVMEPTTRQHIQITAEDAAEATKMLRLLMSDEEGSGKAAAGRRDWIINNVDFDGSDDGATLTGTVDDEAASFKNYLEMGNVLEVNMNRFSKAAILRAIPDVRDGLKPVQRRIIHTANNQKLNHKAPHTKMATVVGQAMAYHPHGDSSIFDAAVRMSHPWSNNAKIMDIDGNKGSTLRNNDWAAMRYIEGRMDKTAEMLIEGLRENTVEFIPSYDNRSEEPVVLPAQFPVLLSNGSSGQAVGFATNIAPHNPVELLKAAELLNRKPEATLSEIMRFVKGPDFPTGGVIMGREGIKQMYSTGSGKVTIRPDTEIEDGDIIIKGLPYGEFRTTVIDSMINAINSSTMVNVVKGINDETTEEGIKIRIELEKGTDPNTVLGLLYKKSKLQISFSANHNAIIKKHPQKFTLKEYLQEFVDFRHEIIRKKYNYELDKKLARLHIIDGFIHLEKVTDEVINTIRNADGTKEDIAKAVMPIGFSFEQAMAIVSTQLYRIAKQDFQALRREKKELTERTNYLKDLLNNKDKFTAHISEILKETINAMKDIKRKSVIEDEIAEIEINESQLIESKDVITVIKPDGVQRMTKTVYENNVDKYEGKIVDSIDTNTTQIITLLTRKGLVIQRTVDEITHDSIKNPVEDLHKVIKTFTYDDEIIAGQTIDPETINDNPLEVVSLSRLGQIKRSKLTDSLLSFNNKGYLTRTKPYNGLKLDNDEIAWLKILPADEVDKMVLTLKLRKRGAKPITVKMGDIRAQGGSGSGIRVVKNLANDEINIEEKYL